MEEVKIITIKMCPRCEKNDLLRKMQDGMLICDRCNYVFTPEESLDRDTMPIDKCYFAFWCRTCKRGFSHLSYKDLEIVRDDHKHDNK